MSCKRRNAREAVSLASKLNTENDGNFTCASGPQEMKQMSPDPAEFNLRVWSFMSPPPSLSAVKRPINAYVIEKTRELLTQELVDHSVCKDREDSVVVQKQQDGKVVSITTQVEKKTFDQTAD